MVWVRIVEAGLGMKRESLVLGEGFGWDFDFVMKYRSLFLLAPLSGY